jgi:LexA-binding, inner membrane-associated putative hydrolase
MANFTTHIAVGTVVSGVLATLTMAADVIAADNLVAVTAAGVLGSVLPDIDLKDSRPAQAMFGGLALFLSFVALFTIGYKFSIAEMWGIWLGTLVGVRYGFAFLFHRFSYHRGIWHSLLAGVFFWFLTAAIFRHILGRPEGVAWLAGGFMFIGYLTHLALDEIYSVDVLDTRIKASFGSAFKLVDSKRWGDTALIGGLTALVFMVTPSANVFVDGITSKTMWTSLHARLLPTDQRWFGIALPNGSTGRLSTSPLTPSLAATPHGAPGSLTAGSLRRANS